jgi:hypothetical protein
MRLTRKQKEELKEKYGIPLGFRNNIPIFQAIKKNEYQMAIFCPYCLSWHNHGLTKDLGHRSAHCIDQRIGGKWQYHSNSPYANRGYYIFLVDGGEHNE